VEGERYIDTHIVPEIWGTKFWQKYKMICKDLLGDKRERERERERKCIFSLNNMKLSPFSLFSGKKIEQWVVATNYSKFARQNFP